MIPCSHALRVAVIDPFLFTLPYDKALTGGLASLGHRVFMIGRALKAHECWDVPAVDYVTLDLGLPTGLTALQPAIYAPAGGLKYSRRMFRLKVLLAELRADIAHFQWTPFPVLDRLAVRRMRDIAPVVLTMHDAVPWAPLFRYRPTVALQRLGSMSILRVFDRVIVHTRSGVAHLEWLGVPRVRIAQIPHGPLDARPGVLTGGPAELEAPIFDCERKLQFLLFGLMKPYKGIDVLIRAVQRMSSDVRQRCRFVVAGSPWMGIGGLQALAEDCGVSSEVVFTPRYFHEVEIPSLFRAADVFVFPYREIQASGVLMLSLRFGRPIVASRIGVFDELLEHGRHGFLVEPDNPQELADALTAIAVDGERRRTMARNVVALAASLSSWAEIAQATVRLYRDAIEAAAGAP